MTPPPREPAEAALITRAKAGDEEAFAQIVAAHGDRIYAALRRFGLTPSEADEVAQEVFVRAWRGLARFEERAQLSTWLYRIAFNEAQRCLARRAPAAAEPLPGDDGELSDPIAALTDAPARGPAAQALDRDFHEQLMGALRELPMDWRAAVVLRDLEGLSTSEAAEITGVQEAAFKSRLHRGRMRLRELLLPYLTLDEHPRPEVD